MGFVLDERASGRRHREPWLISAPDSRLRMYVVSAGEEMMIAPDVRGLLS